ncbi:MAG: ATP-dependent DNA ligase [Candidatus Asgardarchaeia archaeon]
MMYEELCKAYEKLEKTTKRKEMTSILSELFKKVDEDIMDIVVYLTQGKLHPDWTGAPEIGIAEKLAIRSLSMAAGVSEEEIQKLVKKYGDIGSVAEHVTRNKRQMSLFAQPLTVTQVYETLDKVAQASGPGTVDIRLRLLAGLLTNASPIEAKYILRTVTGKLRLGIAEMTILDALSTLVPKPMGEVRKVLERAYNITCDLGYVAKLLKEKGYEYIKELRVNIGHPIRMMLAQRLSKPEEILEKLGGVGWCEYKLDGERFQCHKDGEKVVIFSRRLENITSMYPDGVEYIRKSVKVDKAIVEGEAVPVNPDTLEILPFQELMHRRRKYDIHIVMKKIPVRIYLFDCLLVGDEDITLEPFYIRALKLRNLVERSEWISPVPFILTNDPKALEKFFYESLNSGCEGLVIKSIMLDSIYRAGARSWLWIKLKESYISKMVEPVDLVVVGAFYGRGRRSGTYGALLCAAYNPEINKFETVCKVGSGFTDEDLDKLPSLFEKFVIDEKDDRVISEIEADVWFKPSIVMEVIGDEITLSPVHTCGKGYFNKETGLAIRFPRFTGRWRDDKGPEDATTTFEIIDMYKYQQKKVE